MAENKYDDKEFFGRYSSMDRSVRGLEGAGEWHVLRSMMPSLAGKRVLDLGCGFGWHCKWAAEQGAAAVTGIDLSEKMIEGAKERNPHPGVTYFRSGIYEYDYPADNFDVVISSLAFHYLEDIVKVYKLVNRTLSADGRFIFSVEHPVFTAQGTQDWVYGTDGKPEYWPVDNYFREGEREAVFLGCGVRKYHRTLETYIGGLLENGFRLDRIAEPQPTQQAVRDIPGMENELRRPMMLILSATKL